MSIEAAYSFHNGKIETRLLAQRERTRVHFVIMQMAHKMQISSLAACMAKCKKELTTKHMHASQ